MEFSIASKSFYSKSGSKSTGKSHSYLTPLERKAIRDIRKIKLENQFRDNETPMKQENGKKRDIKPGKNSTYRKLPLCESQSNNTKCPSFNLKGVAHAPQRRSYNWAPKSLNKKFLNNHSTSFTKSIVLPSLHSMSLPCLHTTKTESLQVPADESALFIPKSDDDEALDSPAKIRKLDARQNAIVPRGDLPPAGIKKGEVKDDSSACEPAQRKVFPIFNKVCSPPKSTVQELPASSLSPEDSTKTAKRNSKLRSKDSTSLQFVIDAGQKRFGVTQCSVCGMIYSACHPSDEHDHSLYHKRFLDAIKFVGWKSERVVDTFMDGRIIKVTSADAQYALKKVADMLVIVDSDLGFKTASSGVSESKVTYFFISDSDKIVGCLVAEKISHAYRIISQENQSLNGNPLHFTSTSSSPAVCGISRVWTHAPMRRKKIAARLLDSLRRSFVLGMELESNQIAFSSPTPDGLRFATSYLKVPNILVYNFHR